MIDRAYLENLFGTHEIEQLAGGVDAASDVRVQEAIARAKEEAESRLAPRYEIPVLTPTEELKERVADLTRARLYTTARPEYVDKRTDLARQYLDQAAQGRREIQGLTLKHRTAAGMGTRSMADRVFTRDTMSGY